MKRAHSMRFGATPSEEGVRFALWAPSARDVELCLPGRSPQAVSPSADGWREILLPDVRAGARYQWRIDGQQLVPDPASRFQPDGVFAPSLVVDPTSYDWSDENWRGRPWSEAVLYEAHVGAATPEGDYRALADHLESLRDLGITALELMPLADCPGARGWGYDGVLSFAPKAAYGTPDDLKRLVERAHALGLMVLIDVVYNHFGPAGNFLPLYAKAFFTPRHATPWGEAINFDGVGSEVVRSFFVENALYWLEEFHCDGLRLDAVHAIADDSEPSILAKIAARAREAFPTREIHLILENDANQAQWLERDAERVPRAYTAQWSDDLHHCWHILLTGETEGYYEDYADDTVRRLGVCLTEGFAYQGQPSAHRGGKPRGESSAHLPPSSFVAFLQNHDQVGNRAFGERIGALAQSDRLSLATSILLLSPQIPLLFMGEEWGASSPFLYFVDFPNDPVLSQAVRDGRRREFTHFRAFADELVASSIPDPTAIEAFRRSTLDWTERTRPPHRAVLDRHRNLLALRRAEVTPLASSRFIEALSSEKGGVLEAMWRFSAGTLHLVANFGQTTYRAQRDETATIIWRSDDATLLGTSVLLPPWTGVISKEPSGEPK